MTAPEWIPEFPGQRPPFAPGNQWRARPGNELAVTHGMYSLSRTEPVARRIVAELRNTEGLDYLKAARFKTALWAYARAAAKAELVQQWVDAMPMEQQTQDRPDGAPLELLRRMMGHADRLGDRLGLSPAGAEEIADEIRKARVTLARRAERDALQADLRASLREQIYPGDNQ